MIQVAINFNDDDSSGPADFAGQGNGAISTTDLSIVSGETGKAGDFNGSSTEVQMPDIDAIDGIDKATWLVKFKVDGSTGSDQYIAEDDGINIYYDDSAGDLKVDITANSTVTLSTNISTGSWVTAIIVYDGSTAELFTGGTSQESKSLTGTITAGGDNLHLGYQDAPTHQRYFDGKIEDYRVYDKAATSEQVTALTVTDAGKKIETTKEHSFSTGDILRSDASGNDGRGIVTWIPDNFTIIYLPVRSDLDPSKEIFRVGNIFNTDRQHYIELRDDGVNADIKIFDGVNTTADIDSSDKVTVKIDKSGQIDNSGSQRGELTISDDSVKSVTPTKDTGKIIVWVDGANKYGEVMFDLSSPTGVLLVEMVNDTYSATTGNLSGTTSIDGHVTVSADDTNGEIDIENRTGSQRTFRFKITS